MNDTNWNQVFVQIIVNIKGRKYSFNVYNDVKHTQKKTHNA